MSALSPTSGADARRLALVSVTVAGTLAAVAELARGRPPRLRIAIGAAIAGGLLTIMAEANPKLAGAFAALIMATAIFGVGGDAWTGIVRYLQSPTPTPTTTGRVQP